MMDTLPDRIIDKILFEPNTGHWFWLGGTRHGYGQAWNGQRGIAAHIYIYQQFVGPIPDGLELDHLCRVKRCVNPAHLEPVTHLVNMQRGAQSRKTQCPQGHPYSDTNTYRDPNGHRTCRLCMRQTSARQRQTRPTTLGIDTTPCMICAERPAYVQGRCARCYKYLRQNHRERPIDTPPPNVAGGRALAAKYRGYVRAPCRICHDRPSQTNGRCHRCSNYWYRTDRERPTEVHS